VDDTNTKTFRLRFYPYSESDKGKPLTLKTVGFENDQPGIYKRVDDGWWGIASNDQDRVAQESQGPIYDRTKEHLGAADEGVILLRAMIKESIDAAVNGKDPIWILRDAAENQNIGSMRACRRSGRWLKIDRFKTLKMFSRSERLLRKRCVIAANAGIQVSGRILIPVPKMAFCAAIIDFASTYMSTPSLIALRAPPALNIFEQPVG